MDQLAVDDPLRCIVEEITAWMQHGGLPFGDQCVSLAHGGLDCGVEEHACTDRTLHLAEIVVAADDAQFSLHHHIMELLTDLLNDLFITLFD